MRIIRRNRVHVAHVQAPPPCTLLKLRQGDVAVLFLELAEIFDDSSSFAALEQCGGYEFCWGRPHERGYRSGLQPRVTKPGAVSLHPIVRIVNTAQNFLAAGCLVKEGIAFARRLPV